MPDLNDKICDVFAGLVVLDILTTPEGGRFPQLDGHARPRNNTYQ
jgi:hypothetical protein